MASGGATKLKNYRLSWQKMCKQIEIYARFGLSKLPHQINMVVVGSSNLFSAPINRFNVMAVPPHDDLL